MFGLRILGFRHGLRSKKSHPSRTEPNNLLSSAIAYVAQRICTEAVSAWLLPSDEPRTTSRCWQHLGMKLTSVKLKPKSIRSELERLSIVPNSKKRLLTDHDMATKQIMKIYRCLSEAVNGRGNAMQAVEPCGQEEPLKEVLLTLGLPKWELTDLRNVGGVQWRLFCRMANLSVVFAVIFGG